MSEKSTHSAEHTDSLGPKVNEEVTVEANTEEETQPSKVSCSEDPPPEDDKVEPQQQSTEVVDEAETQANQPEMTEVTIEESQSDGDKVVDEAETQANLPEMTEVTIEESQSDGDVGTSTATVKVVLVPEGHVMTQALMDLGVQPHGSIRMEMSSVDPHSYPLRPVRPPEHDNMPDVITVRVQRGDDSPTSSLSRIMGTMTSRRWWLRSSAAARKPFLGGYRHRLTGAAYHHASTQTYSRADQPECRGFLPRTHKYTVEMKSQAQQCAADVSTQMTGIGCYVSCTNDKLLTPGSYTTAAEYHERRLKAVIRLQAAARRWLAKQAVGRLRQDRNRRLAWLEAQTQRRREEKEEQLRDRRRRWKNPQRREDFNLLYQALETWRKEEEQLINATLRGAQRKVALCSLLDQELEYIKTIGQKQIIFDKDITDRSIRNFLDRSAAPYHWKSAKGERIEMDTMNTIRARELRDLYNDVSATPIKQNDRLEVLMTLKHTVKEHKCELTRDLVDLVDREVDLMTRCVKASSLVGLRQRINTLLLQYIKTPAFNPQVAKLLKVQPDVSKPKSNMLLCASCHHYLPTSSFNPALSSSKDSRCRDCVRLHDIARGRDDSFYKHILKKLRMDEQQLSKSATIPS
ncbi:hypothetical protein WMY93_012292 [Mugilogobius chulae]|uniref:IQ motif and ubiquitin-like domain-containing protein n=1 Tax=Mugilogobius chulae TaxID=88201 RepID=A0AAW0PGD0_9GOBI